MKKKPLHSLTRVALVAAVLLLPMAPARADLLSTLLKPLIGPLTSIFGGLNALQGLLIAVETRLPIILKTLEMQDKQKLATALDASRKEAASRRLDAETEAEFQSDYHSGRCIQSTGGQDQAMLAASSGAAQQAAVNNDTTIYAQTGLSGASAGAVSPGAAKTASVDPVVRGLSEYQKHICLYGNKNEAALAKIDCNTVNSAALPATPDGTQPYAGADTEANTFVGADSYNEDAHYVAAMSFCYALTGNTAVPYAQGKNLTEHIDNMHQFNRAMGDYATQTIAQYFCFDPLARKLPIDDKFAKNNPLFARQAASFTAYAQALSGTRSVTDVDKSAREFLMQGGGYKEVAPNSKVTGQPSLGEQHELIQGQMVSSEQVDEANLIYKWYDPMVLNKMEGADNNIHLGNSYTVRLYKTQLKWREYENAERQLLLEAVALARMTREQMHDPAPVRPTQ